MYYTYNKFNVFIKTIYLLIIILCFTGCSNQEKTPSFAARVVDVYNNKTVLENFKLLYWWEERGETPFLKPYTHSAKELIINIMIPFSNDPHRVTIKTVRIPFQDIDSINIVLSETGKNIKVKTINGQKIVAMYDFPKILMKGENTGLADFKIFVVGNIVKGGKKTKFKLELYRVKTIKLLMTFLQSHQ